ncbi:hypothetical protein SBA4_860022 [Candidatus Sulfopaludibacter sp. SbA4]|nr:hypothetical protein SBA4_860022 [Candidatus Sulfopaludibacter sp. SbA4]
MDSSIGQVTFATFRPGKVQRWIVVPGVATF